MFFCVNSFEENEGEFSTLMISAQGSFAEKGGHAVGKATILAFREDFL